MNIKNAIKIFSFCFIAAAIIFSIDFKVDSYASVRVTYEKIAQMLNEGNVIIGTEIPLSERKIKWAYVNNMPKKDFIILGSSRSALFSSENFTEKSMYNFYTSAGCTVNDYLAELYLLWTQDKLPKRIMIELSSTIFNANSSGEHYKEWGECVDNMKNFLDGKECDFSYNRKLGIEWENLFLPSYFQYNFQQLLAKKSVKVEPTDKFKDAEYSVFWGKDGSMSYSDSFMNLYSLEDIIEQTKKICDSKTLYQCENYYEIDKTLQKYFEKMIDFLQNNNVNVCFYLPPYSEQLYSFITSDEDYKIIPQVEKYILEFAKAKKVKVYGSFDPSGSGITPADLYDAYHIRREKIMDTLWERQL